MLLLASRLGKEGRGVGGVVGNGGKRVMQGGEERIRGEREGLATDEKWKIKEENHVEIDRSP